MNTFEKQITNFHNLDQQIVSLLKSKKIYHFTAQIAS